MSTNGDNARQAGVLPYRRLKDELQILLVTSSTRKRWIIPKGNIEPHLGEMESARREAYEEAGILGSIRRVPLGSYVHEAAARPIPVRVYLMEVERVLEQWPESATRRREWMTFSAARARILEPELKELLLQFIEERV